jgi:hypothetical protein
VLPPGAPFEVTVTSPKEAFVDQPATFKCRIVNTSGKATEKCFLTIMDQNTRTMSEGAAVSALAVKASGTVDISFTPRKTGNVSLIVVTSSTPLTPAITDRFGAFAGTNTVESAIMVAQTQFVVKFDPKTPPQDLLPKAPKASVAGKPRLPQTFADVAEISLHDPLAKTMKSDEAQLYIARTIDRINHLNQKKTDAFMEELLNQRADLFGLPFAMGDSCRLREERGRQFGMSLVHLRRARNFLAAPGGPPSVLVPAMPVPPPPPLGAPAPAPSVIMPQSFVADDPIAVNPNHPGDAILETFRKYCEDGEKSDNRLDANRTQHIVPARIAALMQVLMPEGAQLKVALVKYLAGVSHVEATKALARLAIFSSEAEVRQAAIQALKTRRERDYTAVLVDGLSYPWPAVARSASEAILKLERNDLIPQLLDMLERPDPRGPQTRETGGKKTTVVRELVRINHHRNCLLCHAPAQSDVISGPSTFGPNSPQIVSEKASTMSLLTAQVPLPDQELPLPNSPSGGYSNNIPDILVRIDVTYLRQDFSVRLPISGADPWPEMQRFDFVVRSREVSDADAQAYRDLLQPRQAGVLSPYHRAALYALREMTGLDTAPTAEAWRKLLAQTPAG